MKRKERRKLNKMKVLEYITIMILNIEMILLIYSNRLNLFKTFAIVLSIAIAIKLLKNEK